MRGVAVTGDPERFRAEQTANTASWGHCVNVSIVVSAFRGVSGSNYGRKVGKATDESDGSSFRAWRRTTVARNCMFSKDGVGRG